MQSIQKGPNLWNLSKIVKRCPKYQKGFKIKKNYCCFFWDTLHLTFLCHIHHITNKYHSSAFWRSIPVALFFAFPWENAIQSQQISYKLGIFGSSHLLTFLTFQVLVRDLPSLITGRLYTKYQNLLIKTKKDNMCWFILQVSWLISTYWGWKTTDICAFKIYHAGPSHGSWRGPKLKKTPIFFVDAK